MNNDLLITKLFIPLTRTSLLPRPGILQILDESWRQNKRLILVSAPAGYGKTTLITEWLHHSQVKTAWLSLDEEDNDPVRFLTYLLAALKQVDERFGEASPAGGQPQQALPPTVMLTNLINEISAISSPFILILDDYHTIKTPAIHQVLAFILEHQPPQMHLMIVTREDPLLPLARLRAGGHLTELREDELRFSLGECIGFFRDVMKIELTDQEISALEQRTEGWIAGLQLAALSMQGRSDLANLIRAFTGSNRFVLDYLMEEVFNQQPVDIQNFLIKTSILKRMSGPLCSALVGGSTSQEILEGLEQANLFIIPLDSARRWYRYHRLFAELLQHRLRMSSPDVEIGLQMAASRWFEREGYIPEAIEHALAGLDWAASARLIGRFTGELLRRGETATLINWYQQLPVEVVRWQPDLGLGYAWSLLLSGQFEAADGILKHLEGSAPPDSNLSGQVAAAQAYLARAHGNDEEAIQKSQIAFRLLPEAEIDLRATQAVNLGLIYWHRGDLKDAEVVLTKGQRLAKEAGNRYAELTCEIFLTRVLASQGLIRQAETRLEQIVRLGEQNPILALAYFDLSGISYERNLLARAGGFLEQGLELCKHNGNLEFENSGHLLRAALLLVQNDPAGALEEAKISHSLSRNYNLATQSRSAACYVRIYLALSDLKTAAQWSEQVIEDVDVPSFYRFLGLTRPLLLLAQGRKMEAASGLEKRFKIAQGAGWGYGALAIRVLQALAAEPDKAADYLDEALQMGFSDEYIRTFADLGEQLIPLLQESARRGITPDYARKIISAIKENPALRATSNQILVEPLSQRELEILRWVTGGLSNREIASRLFISPGTVKTHVHNIYGKLGVRNRTEATSLAKELNLI